MTYKIQNYWQNIEKSSVEYIQVDTTIIVLPSILSRSIKTTINFSVTNCERSISKRTKSRHRSFLFFLPFLLSFFFHPILPSSDEIEPIAKVGRKVARGVIMPSIRKVILPSKWLHVAGRRGMHLKAHNPVINVGHFAHQPRTIKFRENIEA